jgi:hypothetical protein
VFLRSSNGRNFFWVDIQNDTDWSVEFWYLVPLLLVAH